MSIQPVVKNPIPKLRKPIQSAKNLRGKSPPTSKNPEKFIHLFLLKKKQPT